MPKKQAASVCVFIIGGSRYSTWNRGLLLPKPKPKLTMGKKVNKDTEEEAKARGFEDGWWGFPISRPPRKYNQKQREAWRIGHRVGSKVY